MVQTPASQSLGGQRGQTPLLQELEALSQALYQAGQRKDDPAVPPSPKALARRETFPVRPVSDVQTRSESLTPLSSSLRSPHPRPPVPGKGTPSPSADSGQKPESFRLETPRAGSESPGRLQPWHSQGFEKSMPEVTNFPEWLEDNVDFSQKLEAPAEKKKGLWGWRPFRAISHMGQQKYNCLFTVHVHGIEALPASMNGLRLTVHFARKDDTGVQTMPSRVFQGYAEFQETLNVRCSLHGSKNGAKGMKWEAKQFVLSVVALDVDELVLGKHKLELSRLLPESIEDDEEKQDTWTTSFKLTGKAQGATLIVTFGCEIQSKDSQNISAASSSRFGESPVLRAVRSVNSLPNSGHGTPQRRPSDAQFSPSTSELSAEGHGMEHLSLDDSHDSPYSPMKGNMRRGSQTYPGEDSKLRMFAQADSMLAPSTPGQSAEGPVEATKSYMHEDQSEDVRADEEEEEEDDDQLEFTVVDQGIEVGTISDTVSSHGYTDLEAEDGSALEEEQAAESIDVSTQAEEEEDDDAPAQPEDRSEDGIVPDNDGEVFKDSRETEVEDTEETRSAEREVSDEEEEFEKQITDYNEGRTQPLEAIHLSEVEHIPTVEGAQNSEQSDKRSMDDELEMEELLAALGDQEEGFDGGEHVESTQDYENSQEADSRAIAVGYSDSHHYGGATNTEQETEKHVLDLPDDMTEEELLSLLPGEVDSDWKLEKGASQSKVPESDDEFDPVAGEFLSLLETEAGPMPVALTSDSEPDSPRAVLLKQFEQEAMLESGLELEMKMPKAPHYMEHPEVPEFYLDSMSSESSFDAGPMEEPRELPAHKHTLSEDYNNLGWGSEEDVELASIMEAAESELQKATQTMRSKTRAKMLEDEETEALMQEWGLNKKVFEASPPKPTSLDDTGNPYALVVADAPPLGMSLGPVVQTRDGGSLRSMSPANFQATSGGKLVMQVSKPVVVPVDMGASSMDILRRMAAAGMEGMADQAMMAMPLDDITGKSVEQIASEGFAALEGSYQQGRGQYGYPALEGGQGALSLEYGQEAYSSGGALATRGGPGLATAPRGRANRRKSNPKLGDDTFMSLEDLAPMAMQKIEALALEGLKVQSDLAEEEAPYMVDPLSWQEMAAIEGGPTTRRRGGKSGGISSLEGVTAMRLLEGGSAEVSGDDDGLSMAISLDEWMRLDAGVYDENETNDNTMALLATHHATHGDIVPSKQKNSDRGKQGGKQGADATNLKGGFMGDTLTLAMLVQLRDPLRNYEPVGAPMMALVQAERVMVPPTPKVRLGRRISLKGNNEDSDEESDAPTQPQFKIVEVTMSGLKTSEETASDTKKQIGWGNQKQQQSGSRWLVASGMTKTAKHPVLQSKAKMGATPAAASKATSGAAKADSLWSISSKAGSKWGAPAAAKTRNPDVAMAKTGWFGRKK